MPDHRRQIGSSVVTFCYGAVSMCDMTPALRRVSRPAGGQWPQRPAVRPAAGHRHPPGNTTVMVRGLPLPLLPSCSASRPSNTSWLVSWSALIESQPNVWHFVTSLQQSRAHLRFVTSQLATQLRPPTEWIRPNCCQGAYCIADYCWTGLTSRSTVPKG